jgi:hypothetical protein
MKKLVVLCATVFIAFLLVISSCQIGDESIPVYAGPTVSGELPSSWQKTTITELEHLLGTQLPLPTYLPPGYEIKEVYYSQVPNSSPPVTEVLLLISEQQAQWVGNKYTCRLALSLGWNEAGLGLKMPYILWWESYGSPESLGSTLRLHASRQFSKEELIKIAASAPTTTPFFPVQMDGLDQMNALAEGKLVLDSGYLRLKPSFGESHLLIWPYGYSLSIEGKEIQVIDSDGQVAARVGDRIKVGGGEVPAEIVERYIGQPLPDNCPGPYWIVSEVVQAST